MLGLRHQLQRVAVVLTMGIHELHGAVAWLPKPLSSHRGLQSRVRKRLRFAYLVRVVQLQKEGCFPRLAADASGSCRLTGVCPIPVPHSWQRGVRDPAPTQRIRRALSAASQLTGKHCLTWIQEHRASYLPGGKNPVNANRTRQDPPEVHAGYGR